MAINDPDLNTLKEKLRQLLAELIGTEEFTPAGFVPTVLTLSPQGEIHCVGFPIGENDQAAVVQVIKTIRKFLGEEGGAGRLTAYAYVLFPPPDEEKNPDEPVEASFILENQFGDGCIIQQSLEKDAAGKFILGGEVEHPLEPQHRLWQGPAEEVEPAESAKPAEPTPEEQQQEFITKHIPKAADTFCQMIKSMDEPELDYSAESIARLDGILDKYWPEGPALPDMMIMNLGSYLGESIRRIHDGHWAFDEELHFHVVAGGIKACPFNKVRKRLANGEEDSLEFFYRIVAQQIANPESPMPPGAIPLPPRPARKKSLVVPVFILLTILVLGAIGYHVFRLAKSRTPAQAAGSPATTTNQAVASPPAATSPGTNEVGLAGITIVSANFGMGDKVADVTAKVQELLLAHPDGFIADYKSLKADPLPGKKKKLTVKYTYLGTNEVLVIPGARTLSPAMLLNHATN